MKQLISFLVLTLITLTCFCQVKKDSGAFKSPIDTSKYEQVLPDTVVFKIPRSHLSTFEAMLLGQDHSHSQHIEVLELYVNQVKKQYVKKLKK